MTVIRRGLPSCASSSGHVYDNNIPSKVCLDMFQQHQHHVVILVMRRSSASTVFGFYDFVFIRQFSHWSFKALKLLATADLRPKCHVQWKFNFNRGK